MSQRLIVNEYKTLADREFVHVVGVDAGNT